MLENILYNLVFSLISGLTEFLCVDATAHRMLYQMLSGQKQAEPLLMVFIRAGVLTALIFSNWSRIRHLSRERKMSMRSRHRQNWQSDPIAQLDLRVLKTAAIPAVFSVLLYKRAGEVVTGFLPLALVMTVNGIILFIPRLLSQGNKDARSVSRLDAILIGLGSAIGAVPGLSAMGGMLTAGAVRGLDRSYALDTALLLSIPLLAGLLIFDAVAVVTAKISFDLVSFLLYFLYAAVAFGSAWLTIALMRYLSVKLGFSGFAYYSWGFALFAFILYLMI